MKPNAPPKRYKIYVRYKGDTIRTHGWCEGVSVPRIEFVWRIVDEQQLEKIRTNALFELRDVIEMK